MTSVKTSKFRAPTNNVRYTKQLFWDCQKDMPLEQRLIPPMYTLHEDVEGLINFRKAYVGDMDPSGYKTAMRLLENYEHWNILMRTKWFQAAKKEWDKEIKAKMEKEAVDTLMSIMRDEDNSKVSERMAAAKAILGKAKTLEEKKHTVGRGRPSAEEVKGHLKEAARLTKEEAEDAKRINITGI